MALNSNRRSASSGSRRSRTDGARGAGRPRPSASAGYRTVPSAGRGGADPQGRVRSTRIGDIRAVNKGRAQRGKRKMALIFGAVAAVAVALIVAVGALSASGALAVTNLTFKGVTHLTDGEMKQLAEIPEGASLLTVDTDEIRKNLLRDAWIQDASVNRIPPNTLELAVTERTVMAIVEVQTSPASPSVPWAIASDGVWLMPIPDQDSEAGKQTSAQIYEDADSVMHIQNMVISAEPQIGQVCTDESVNNALSIISGMSTDLAGQVKTMSATDADSTTLILQNGIEIAFGNADNIRDKERVCLQLMDQYQGSIAYINVRSVERPTWRSA